jgi:hypothetical protein
VVDEAGRDFNPDTAGSITGRVTWQGPLPVVESFDVPPNPMAGPALWKKRREPNPNAPRIDPDTRGVGNAVIFLRGLDARRGKRWNYPPVQVEQRDCRFHVLQGDAVSQVGFVRQGAAVEMVSQDDYFYSLHADGAAYFSLAFPDPGQPLQRSLPQKGLVELSSGAGYFWMRAYLFVDDHPYYTRTDAQGRFQLTQVPPGRFELVCWMPNWREARHERDAESGELSRLLFQLPLEQHQKVILQAKESRELHFKWDSSGIIQEQAPRRIDGLNNGARKDG